MLCYKIIDRYGYSFMLGPHSKYSLKYKKGTIVEFIPDTLGIFCFDTIKNARRFAELCVLRRCKIIKVRGINQNPINKICSQVSDISLDDFYSNVKTFKSLPPVGTLFFEKVEVLE